MKLKRNELVAKLAKIIPEEAANKVLDELRELGVIESMRVKEIVPRRDIELMPYDDEVYVDEFGF